MLPIFDTKNSSTKDKIISILSVYPNLNTKKINSTLKKQYALDVTYQAVHKTLKQMVEQGVLTHDGKSYGINQKWIDNLTLFANKTRKIANGIKDGDNIISDDFNTKVIEVNSLKDVDEYWLNYEKDALKTLAMLPKEKRIIYLYLPHCWFALSYPQNEHEFMRDLKKINGKVYYFCEGDNIVDRWVRDFYHNYPDSPYKIFLGVKAGSVSEKWISPTKVTDVIFPSGFLKVYDDLYNNTKDIRDIQLGQFLDEVYKIREPIQIIENKNEKVISNIQTISKKKTESLLMSEEKINQINIEKKSFIEYWNTLNNSKKEIIDLGMKMPSPNVLKIPNITLKKLHESIDNGEFVKYTRQEGDINCVKEIIKYENGKIKNNQFYSDSNLMFTPGAIRAFSLIIDNFLDKDDEIFMWKPMYFSQLYLSKTKSKPKIVQNKDYNASFKSFKENITSDTKMVAICQPNNPTGLYIPKEELKNIIDFAKKKKRYGGHRRKL
jgi:hypothetical protein